MPITQVDIDEAQSRHRRAPRATRTRRRGVQQGPGGLAHRARLRQPQPRGGRPVRRRRGAGGGAAVAAAVAAASSGAGAVAAELNPVVYNNYYEIDNSITNNIEADGNVNVNRADR